MSANKQLSTPDEHLEMGVFSHWYDEKTKEMVVKASEMKKILQDYGKEVVKYTLEQAEGELPMHLSGNILSLESQIIKDLGL